MALDDDPTDAGYDEATAIADGRDAIPTTVARPIRRDLGARPAGSAEDTDDYLDDVHDVDEMSDLMHAPEHPRAEVNTLDNQARWSEQP